jgi:cytochrome c-type biogenesis protein CcmH
MTLWLLMMMLCSATAVAVVVPLVRRFDASQSNDQNNLAIYQDQLQEIERDLQAGTINAPEAAASKIEIQRRLALVQKNAIAGKPISLKLRNAFAALAAGLVIIGGVSLYGFLGHPDQTQTTAAAPPPQMNAMVAKLQAHLKDTPNDAEGWRMLGLAQFDLQNYKDSVAAYAKALSLDPQNTGYKSAYAETLVQLAQGIVTPDAKTMFAEVLTKDPKDARARFYDAMAQEQSGDQAGALIKWQALLADAPADAAWRGAVQQRIAALKPIAPQISADQKAQVQSLSPADQNAMIASMVERLAGKLAANPDNVEGWINLMKAYQVLAKPDKAKEALAKALATFANDPTKKAQITAAATDLGLN